MLLVADAIQTTIAGVESEMHQAPLDEFPRTELNDPVNSPLKTNHSRHLFSTTICRQPFAVECRTARAATDVTRSLGCDGDYDPEVEDRPGCLFGRRDRQPLSLQIDPELGSE